METISSWQTALFKYVLPCIWAGLSAMYLASPAAPKTWQFIVVWATLSVGWGAWVVGLKRVQLEGRTLVISGYRRRIRVLVSELAEVTENRFWNPKLVTLRFRRPTRFGRTVRFIPCWPSYILDESDIVGRLRRLAREAVQNPGYPPPE